MDQVELKRTLVQGFEALDVSNGLVGFSVVPELGGKLSSLRDLEGGREWLWTSQRMAYARHEYGASYVKHADVGGWDECFPTVAACDYPWAPRAGEPLPDHGEVWPRAWEHEARSNADGSVTLTGRTQGTLLEYSFERLVSLALGSRTLSLTYRVINDSPQELAFIWSAHPLFRLEAGLRLRFPEATRWNVYLEAPGTVLPPARPFTWPFAAITAGGRWELDPLPGPGAGVAFKAWSEPLAEGWAELVSPTGRLRLDFNPREVPQLGLWLNAGGWSGDGGPAYANLALEPCIGAQDSLAEAVGRYGQFGRLAAGATREWGLNVTLTPTSGAEGKGT